jgi:hypothetical protein
VAGAGGFVRVSGLDGVSRDERLGYKVTIEPVTREADLDTGQLIARAS